MICMRPTFLSLIFLLISSANAGSTVEDIRVWSENDKTRVVLDLNESVNHNIFSLQRPERLVIDLKDSQLSESFNKLSKKVGFVESIRSAMRPNGELRVVLDLSERVIARSFRAGPNTKYGDRLVIDLVRSLKVTTVKRVDESYQSKRNIIIAVDAGHGGRDPGALGRKSHEKNINLAISKELAARINAEQGMQALMIRKSDVFIELRDRISKARDNKADLFISIHADAFHDSRANGASVFALNLKGANDEAARQLQRRETSQVSVGGVSLHDKDEILASVLLDLSQKESLSVSLDVGARISREMSRVTNMHSKEIKQKSFLVLKAPDIPSILVETGFISNRADEKKLRNKKHQEKLASALVAGIKSYFYANPPPDSKIAYNLRNMSSTQLRHVIVRGDTISQIAEFYNVSPSAIRRLNNLSNDNIRVGQTLNIPKLAGG
ncbi:MAG: N-acetylmuramoyl-L-alanine amidase [Woeseia sp.]|nr:N-acetylmuramoyl-L-alanine amidase [Woeseia sp.]